METLVTAKDFVFAWNVRLDKNTAADMLHYVWFKERKSN